VCGSANAWEVNNRNRHLRTCTRAPRNDGWEGDLRALVETLPELIFLALALGFVF
jgi:hypothetical protein